MQTQVHALGVLGGPAPPQDTAHSSAQAAALGPALSLPEGRLTASHSGLPTVSHRTMGGARESVQAVLVTQRLGMEDCELGRGTSPGIRPNPDPSDCSRLPAPAPAFSPQEGGEVYRPLCTESLSFP